MTQPATQSLAYDVGVLSRHVGTIADNEDLFQKVSWAATVRGAWSC